MLRTEGEWACVAQMARAKIRRLGWRSPSQRATHLWLVRTLQMHRWRRLTCGTRSFIISEVQNGLSDRSIGFCVIWVCINTSSSFDAQCALCSLCPRVKASTGQELLPQPFAFSRCTPGKLRRRHKKRKQEPRGVTFVRKNRRCSRC
jgi:hypothetical protein